METLRLVWVVEEDAVIFHARRAEIVRGAAERHHQGVVGHLALRHQHFAVVVAHLRQLDGFALAIDVGQRTELELKAMVARMRQIAQRVDAFVHRSGRHFVQQRLPQVAVVAIHQNNLGLFPAAQLVTELRCHLQPARAATDNNDFFHGYSQQDPLKM